MNPDTAAVAVLAISAQCAEVVMEYNNLVADFIEAESEFEEETIQVISMLQNIEEEMGIQSPRSVWMKPANQGFWEEIVPKFTDSSFRDHFRVNRETFEMIVSKLHDRMVMRDTTFRKCIPVPKKIAIALTVLSTNCEYRQIAATFGVGKTTVHDCFMLFLEAAEKVLVPEYIQWPNPEQFKKIAVDFEQRWQYPMGIGAIDGCHVRITVHDELKTDYHNYKGDYSILSLCICDANYQFYYVKTGIPGRANDAGVFRGTDIFTRAAQDLFPVSTRLINDTEIPYHLLGDSAFPLNSWLMKPYLFRNAIPEEERRFNKRHSRARRVIENAFGRLKGRWRRLLKDPLEIKLEDASKAVMVALALHNICERCRVPFDNRLFVENSSTTMQFQSQDYSIVQAKLIRDALKIFFSQQSFQPE